MRATPSARRVLPGAPILSGLLVLLAAVTALWAAPASAGTRRAFLVGIERYEGNIQRLTRSSNDANDLAKDLEKLGFDKKNITVAIDLRTKADFEKKFDAFIKTVQTDDVVVFFFSGHGMGVDTESKNYLLFSDLKSLFGFTRAKLSESERKNADVVRLRMPTFVDQYETEEVVKNGISVADIQAKIAAKKPRVALMILDACRSLAPPDPNADKLIARGPESGSRLVRYGTPPEGFLVLFSASFGEQAAESYGSGERRNSLFTEILRSELWRPGQTLTDLAERVRLVVRATATTYGLQQEPEFASNLGAQDEFALIDPIGAERFTAADDACQGSEDDYKQIMRRPKREELERHRRRFQGCKTAEQARWALANLADTTEDTATVATVAASASRPIDDCDRLAASGEDGARPPDVAGVRLDQIDSDEAKRACEASIKRNPRVARFLFNLGRAEQAVTNGMRSDDPERREAFLRARLAFDDAAKRGYVAALNNLAILYDNGYGVERSVEEANELLKRAASQGFPLAMYNLGLRLKNGETGIPRDLGKAYEWFAKAAESGFKPAMVEVGFALWRGAGIRANPRRAIDSLQRAADAGSTQAKRLLGEAYGVGKNASAATGVKQDDQLSLLWYARAAEARDPVAYYHLAQIMESGRGLSSPLPELAERYYRLAAASGDVDAQVLYADRIGSGALLIKTDTVATQRTDLLKRALSQGSTQAAVALARIYRDGESGEERDPVKAVRYAFEAMRLAVQSNPTEAKGNPFYELTAGMLLVDMARKGEALDRGGKPLFTPDEIDRMETYYGRPDRATKEVKVRRLVVPLTCGSYGRLWRSIWVWDWGRDESPTEPQFRSLERETGCAENKALRETLMNSFTTSRKNKVAFADLIQQQIVSARNSADAQASRKSR